ncbi:MAG: phosphomannomutase, partial [Gammaproteobacteria bacterium]
TSSPIRFGTSGVRGLVSDMSDEVCCAYTLTFLHVIAAEKGGRVALGIDLRPSSPRIAAACAAAIRYAGLEVDYCGPLPTPALAYYAQQQGIPAVMVTGSHIPFDRNGIKFYRASGEITKADEAAIITAALAMPETIENSELPPINPAACRLYIDRYCRFFATGQLAGLRLGFYEHSGAARDLLREILQALGAEVVSLGRSDEFVPIDTEAVSAADAEKARQWVREYALDGIFSTDGDADRPLIGDEQGNWLRGDVAGILCALSIGAEAVATPVSSNTALEKCGAFTRVLRTRIGSPYVIAGMEELIRAGCRNVVGFEPNGGFLVGATVEKHGRILEALPTRDAVLPIIALFAMAKEAGLKLSALPQRLPARYTASDRLQDFPGAASQALLQKLAASESAIQALFGSLCGSAATLDRTDGLRIGFKNGDIVHLRPSGNAPELRCYAEADTAERAARLVRECLARIADAAPQ